MSGSTICWSSDCLHHMCNLPHTVAQHIQEVEQARYERQLLREEGKRELADGELDEERMAWETRNFRVGGEAVSERTVSDTTAQGKDQEHATA